MKKQLSSIMKSRPPYPASLAVLNQGSRELRKSAITGITITACHFMFHNAALRIRCLLNPVSGIRNRFFRIPDPKPIFLIA
jgi:hypothetical protein